MKEHEVSQKAQTQERCAFTLVVAREKKGAAMDGKQKIRILVAEDDANVLQTVAMMFEANGYDVKTAADASGVGRKRF